MCKVSVADAHEILVLVLQDLRKTNFEYAF